MPRLSVDIDLAYLPIEPREMFLSNLTSRLFEMKKLIEAQNLIVKPSYTKDKQLAKLLVYKNGAAIKVEPNLVIRGSTFDCEEYDLCQKAQDQFLKFSRIKTLSFADLYGGKICAALDRQHPRDLFDVKLLLEDQGITDDVRKALIIYIISSPRPIHELLNANPNLSNFENIFNNEFAGMTDDISLTREALIDIRHRLIRLILEGFTENERHFLISVKMGAPDWSLMPISGIEKLPAILWKLENIKRIPENKKDTSLDKLKKILKL
jgi:hypothetical protein